jgi:CRP-like cAMP-binding protein
MIKKGLVGFSLSGNASDVKGSRHAGEFFGEVALLEGKPAQSTAITQTVSFHRPTLNI